MGAGDVKALAALGTLIGPKAIFAVFLFTGLIGGCLSLLHYVLSRNLLSKLAQWWRAMAAFLYTRKIDTLVPASTVEKLRFPYATAIALGYFSHLTWENPLLKIFH